MPSDPDARAAIETKATVLTVRADFLHRQLLRCDDLPEEMCAWLDAHLVALAQAAHQLATIVADGQPRQPRRSVTGFPTSRLMAYDVSSLI